MYQEFLKSNEKEVKELVRDFFGICMEMRLQMTEQAAEIIAVNLMMSGYRKTTTTAQ